LNTFDEQLLSQAEKDSCMMDRFEIYSQTSKASAFNQSQSTQRKLALAPLTSKKVPINRPQQVTGNNVPI